MLEEESRKPGHFLDSAYTSYTLRLALCAHLQNGSSVSNSNDLLSLMLRPILAEVKRKGTIQQLSADYNMGFEVCASRKATKN